MTDPLTDPIVILYSDNNTVLLELKVPEIRSNTRVKSLVFIISLPEGKSRSKEDTWVSVKC